MNRKEQKRFRMAMDKEIKEHRNSFIVFSVLRLLVIASMVRQVMLGNYEGVFFCGLTFLLLYIPSWVQVRFHVELPPPLEITILCFIFAAEILGEVNAFYVLIPGWDTILHTLNGFLAAAVGFSLVMLLNDNERPHLRPFALFPCPHRLLLFHDHRRAVGILRVCHGLLFPYRHAEGHGHPHELKLRSKAFLAIREMANT